ncbi:MAG: 50S ribosomal protein L3 [Alphaproteobacteria bacterium]|nr:MAG: 50S ribosomal protein L3 [Alphaproteobacteria bacterium]
MRSGLILKKMGMTRIFDNSGNSFPVTVLKLEENQVVKVLDRNKNGYFAIQVGTGKVKTKNIGKAIRGHFAKSNVEPKKILKEFRVDEDMLVEEGKIFSINHFSVGQKIDVSGVSHGKGFSGGMKRHNFAGLEATHGVSISHRSHGSTGNSQDPGRVWKGKKMAGQYGNVNKTIQNLIVLQINDVDDLLYVKGSVPGPKNGYLTVRDAIKSTLPESALKPAGLKNNEKSEINISNQKEIFQDEDASIKTENVEVKNEQSNDQKVTGKTITSGDESSNSEITDTYKNTINKEV